MQCRFASSVSKWWFCEIWYGFFKQFSHPQPMKTSEFNSLINLKLGFRWIAHTIAQRNVFMRDFKRSSKKTSYHLWAVSRFIGVVINQLCGRKRNMIHTKNEFFSVEKTTNEEAETRKHAHINQFIVNFSSFLQWLIFFPSRSIITVFDAAPIASYTCDAFIDRPSENFCFGFSVGQFDFVGVDWRPRFSSEKKWNAE